nr:inositol transporter 4-like [Ipomoea batatas]
MTPIVTCLEQPTVSFSSIRIDIPESRTRRNRQFLIILPIINHEERSEKVGADKTKFTECWETSRKTPYIMRLPMSAGIGGPSLWLVMTSERIVIVGSALGGGRKGWILIADVVSNTSPPLYLRGALVTINGLLGQYAACRQVWEEEADDHLHVRDHKLFDSLIWPLNIPRQLASPNPNNLDSIQPAPISYSHPDQIINRHPGAATRVCISMPPLTTVAFCSNKTGKYNPGACLSVTDEVKHLCQSEGIFSTSSNCSPLVSSTRKKMVTSPMSEQPANKRNVPEVPIASMRVKKVKIYPLRYRGVGGITAAANWVSNLVVSLTFSTLIEAIGTSGTFLLFAGCSLTGLVAIFFPVPETKGLQFEEVEKMLEKGYKPSFLFSYRNTKQQSAIQGG